jgi:hypothetical protein
MAGTAQNYCAALTLAGGGWRLPSLVELSTLIDYSSLTGQNIDSNAFPNTPAAGFWSATPLVNSGGASAWGVGFDYGYTTTDVTSAAHYVRCVR